MKTMIDRLRTLEEVRVGRTRYRVCHICGTVTIERDILPLLTAALDKNCTIVSIEPLHQGPHNYLERLAIYLVNEQFNKNETIQ